MKLIAHRGASLRFQENSIQSLVYAAKVGAYAVECDIRQTKDKQYVIFHDENLVRTAGAAASVSELTLSEMKDLLSQKGYGLLTFLDLAENYKEKTPILLHIKLANPDAYFVRMLKDCKIDLVCGIQQPETVKLFSAEFPRNRILAFMPQPEMYPDFTENGAGIIRLWEYWLPSANITTIKNSKHTPEVWIMSCDENTGMNGNINTLNRFKHLGADGVLLNDIDLAVEWQRAQQAI